MTRYLPTARSHPRLLLIVRRTYRDVDGPGRKWAWLVHGRFSRTRRTIYTLGTVFRRIRRRGSVYRGTHINLASGLEYYIRGTPTKWCARRYLFDLECLLDLSEGEEV